MAAKNDNITKDPAAAARRGHAKKPQRGKKKRKTILKEQIEDWSKAEGLVEKNILEFLQSKNKKRLEGI
jgi:hypothetical protein